MPAFLSLLNSQVHICSSWIPCFYFKFLNIFLNIIYFAFWCPPAIKLWKSVHFFSWLCLVLEPWIDFRCARPNDSCAQRSHRNVWTTSKPLNLMTESIPAHQATVPSTGDTSERENYVLPKCAEKALGKRGPSAASQSDDAVIHYLLVTPPYLKGFRVLTSECCHSGGTILSLRKKRSGLRSFR